MDLPAKYRRLAELVSKWEVMELSEWEAHYVRDTLRSLLLDHEDVRRKYRVLVETYSYPSSDPPKRTETGRRSSYQLTADWDESPPSEQAS